MNDQLELWDDLEHPKHNHVWIAESKSSGHISTQCFENKERARDLYPSHTWRLIKYVRSQ